MISKTLSPQGTFTDVAYHDGLWYAVWQDGPTVIVCSLNAVLEEVVRVTIDIGQSAGAFPKLLSAGANLWLAFRRGSPDYHVVLRNLTDFTSRDIGIAHGNDPCVLGHGLIAWQATSGDYDVMTQPLAGGGSTFVRLGAPDGLSRILADGSITLIKDDRFAVPGYTRPCWAAGAVVVEGQGLYDLLIRDDGLQARAFDGQDAPTPRLATDGQGRYLVGTWGKQGVRVALVEPQDFAAPPAPVPAPLPDVPFVAIAGAVVEDLLPRFVAQCTAQQGNVLWFRKSDPPDWGAWHDFDDHNIGLLADSSTGKMLPDGRLDSMFFGGSHLWFPRRCVNGWTAEYDTTFIWADGARIPRHITLQVYVGHGRYQGVDVDIKHVYDNRSPDPKNPRRQLPDGTWVGRMAGYLEIDYLGPSGFVRWEAWHDDDAGVPQLVQFTQPYPIAARGAFVPPPRPQPYDAIITIAQPPEKPVSLSVQDVITALHALPWDVDVAHLDTFRSNVWKRDQIPDTVTRGALSYYHREVFAALVERFNAMGRLPGGPPEQVFKEWDDAFTLGTQRAIAAYRREIMPDPEDGQNPQ